MNELSQKEIRLITVFLKEFKKMVHARVGIPFNPRSLTIVSQPDLTNENKFDYISYNKWFDEVGIQSYVGSTNTILQAHIDVPMRILIDSEKLGQAYISKKDAKKIIRAYKLIEEIKMEKQR